MTKPATLLTALAAALALSACGGTPAKPGPAVTTPTFSTPAPSTQVNDEPDMSTVEPEPSDMVAAFGETFTYDDGLQVTVGKPTTYKPSEYAELPKGTHLVMPVVLKNGTDKPIDPAMFYSTMASGEQEAEAIFDSAKGLEGSPSTKLRPGKSVKFKMGFTVADPKDLTLELTPDSLEYTEVIFTNTP